MVSVLIRDYALDTALGRDLEDVWAQLCSGKTGIKQLRDLSESKGGYIDDLAHLNADEKMFQLADISLNKLIVSNSIATTSEDVCLILGTSFGARLSLSVDNVIIEETWIKKLKDKYKFKNIITLSTACSSGSDTIALAYHLIQTNKYKQCLCGGVDLITLEKIQAHRSLGTLSQTTLKAYDSEHNGTILGDGAGFILLEASEHKSFDNIYVIGVGSANDAAGLTAPDKESRGAKLAIFNALEMAKISAKDTSIINGHGSGTILNDITEANAYTLFPHETKISATKGAFGHTLGATGSIECIILAETLKRQVSPPIYGLTKPMENFPIDLIKEVTPLEQANYGLSLTMGFGGFVTAIVLERSKECL